MIPDIAMLVQGPTEDGAILQLREALAAIVTEYKAYTEEERKQVRRSTWCLYLE